MTIHLKAIYETLWGRVEEIRHDGIYFDVPGSGLFHIPRDQVYAEPSRHSETVTVNRAWLVKMGLVKQGLAS